MGRTTDGATPLYGAALHGEADVVKTLLNCSQVDVNKGRTKDGHTALFIASKLGRVSIVRMLLEDNKTDVVYGTTRQVENVSFENSDLVFVGYGVSWAVNVNPDI